MIQKEYGPWERVRCCQKCWRPVVKSERLEYEGICQHCGYEQDTKKIKTRRRVYHTETNPFLYPFRLNALLGMDYWEYLL